MLVVCLFFSLSLQASARQGTREFPSMQVIVYFSSCVLWKGCLASDHGRKEAHYVFKSVNALCPSPEGEEINSVRCFLPSHV